MWRNDNTFVQKDLYQETGFEGEMYHKKRGLFRSSTHTEENVSISYQIILFYLRLVLIVIRMSSANVVNMRVEGCGECNFVVVIGCGA